MQITAAVAPLAPLAALSLEPGPEEIAGAIWTCCDVEIAMNDYDRAMVAYTSEWTAAKWPGQVCPKCGGPMAMASQPRPIAQTKAAEPTKLLTKAERIARHEAAKRAAELLVQDNSREPARTLEEAKRRLMPWGGDGVVGKPLGDLPRSVLIRARAWANAKRRRFRFVSLIADIDLVIAPSDDFEAAPAGLDDTGDELEFAS